MGQYNQSEESPGLLLHHLSLPRVPRGHCCASVLWMRKHEVIRKSSPKVKQTLRRRLTSLNNTPENYRLPKAHKTNTNAECASTLPGLFNSLYHLTPQPDFFNLLMSSDNTHPCPTPGVHVSSDSAGPARGAQIRTHLSVR